MTRQELRRALIAVSYALDGQHQIEGGLYYSTAISQVGKGAKAKPANVKAAIRALAPLLNRPAVKASPKYRYKCDCKAGDGEIHSPLCNFRRNFAP